MADICSSKTNGTVGRNFRFPDRRASSICFSCEEREVHVLKRKTKKVRSDDSEKLIFTLIRIPSRRHRFPPPQKSSFMNMNRLLIEGGESFVSAAASCFSNGGQTGAGMNTRHTSLYEKNLTAYDSKDWYMARLGSRI